MTWKNTIKKEIFEKDPEEMTDFMNISPRMKQEAEKRKAIETESEFSKDLIEQTNKIKEHLDTLLDGLEENLRQGITPTERSLRLLKRKIDVALRILEAGREMRRSAGSNMTQEEIDRAMNEAYRESDEMARRNIQGSSASR